MKKTKSKIVLPEVLKSEVLGLQLPTQTFFKYFHKLYDSGYLRSEIVEKLNVSKQSIDKYLTMRVKSEKDEE